MGSPMTPREIQSRIRSGDSLADVVAAADMPADRVEVFAAPILAEREHTTAEALAAPVRRRGETASARRLSQTVAENLLNQGDDINRVTWDSWRRSDGRWVLQGTWHRDDHEHVASYVFDPRGRFCVADNDEARLLIGDLPIGAVKNPQNEPTASNRRRRPRGGTSLADETTVNAQPEESMRSDLDLLYSMISTIDEDSVRIFRGLREPIDSDNLTSPDQPPLLDEPEPIPQPAPSPAGESTLSRRRRRAAVPSWDEIMFGGRP